MKKRTTIILASLSTIILIVTIVIILSNRKSENVNTPNVAETEQLQENIWSEITTDGVNEELLLQNIDQDLLEQIAYELQTLVAEATEEERQDPEIAIREGWTRIWQYERYQKVLSIGTPAMKPLYLIIYKSPYAGEYEYLCANILYELSGFDFEWTNSKEFLEKFNQAVIEQKG